MITSEVVGIRANVDDVVCGLSDAADADIPELFQVSDDFMMEGRWQRGQSLPGLPTHLYDLFPDRLVDSELG